MASNYLLRRIIEINDNGGWSASLWNTITQKLRHLIHSTFSFFSPASGNRWVKSLSLTYYLTADDPNLCSHFPKVVGEAIADWEGKVVTHTHMQVSAPHPLQHTFTSVLPCRILQADQSHAPLKRQLLQNKKEATLSRSWTGTVLSIRFIGQDDFKIQAVRLQNVKVKWIVFKSMGHFISKVMFGERQ